MPSHMDKQPLRVATIIAGLAVVAAPDPAAAQCIDRGGGYLHATLTGAIVQTLSWDNAHTVCGGGAIEGGVSVTFERLVAREGTTEITGSGRMLSLTIRIFDIGPGHIRNDLPATVLVGGPATGGVVFQTEDGACSVNISENRLLSGEDPRIGGQEGYGAQLYRVSGVGRCHAPANPVSGGGAGQREAIRIGLFEFSGPVGTPSVGS